MAILIHLFTILSSPLLSLMISFPNRLDCPQSFQLTTIQIIQEVQSE